MSYKLIPRFYYTLSQNSFLTAAICQKTNYVNVLPQKHLNNSKITYLNTARASLRVLLSSVSKRRLNVGVQAYTCHTVFQAIKYAGHDIIFLDINKDLNLDSGNLNNKIKKLDVLIITHTFGYPEQIEKIKEIAKEKIVIEDCAHSFLSRHKSQLTGTMFDAAIFSTGIGKFPPIGAGGFFLVNAPEKFPELKHEMLKLSQPGFLSSVKIYIKTLALSFLMKPPVYGLLTHKIGKQFDSKLDFINKNMFVEKTNYPWANKMLGRQLNTIYKIKEAQKKNAQFLASLIKNKSIIKKPKQIDDPNYYAFPLVIENRDFVFDVLFENNIEAGKHFSQSLDWAAKFGYVKGSCPNTESIVNKILTIPVHYGVSVKQIKKIAKILNKHTSA